MRKQSRASEARRFYLRQAEILAPLDKASDQLTEKQLLNCYRPLGEIEIDRKTAEGYLKKAVAIAQNIGDETSAAALRRTLATLR